MATLRETSEAEESTDNVAILKRLEQYGESWLDEKDYQKYVRKIQSKPRKSPSHSETGQPEDKGGGKKKATMSRRQRKTLKRKITQNSDQGLAENERDRAHIRVSVKRKGNRHLEELKSELELENGLPCKPKGKTEEPKTSHHHNVIMSSDSDGKLFVFEDPAKRKQKKKEVISPVTDPTPAESRVEPTQAQMNLRDARHDVKMFGIQGFQGKRKETAVTDMLMKLGAKAPKKASYNYKEFMEIRKQEISESKDRQEMGKQFGFKNSKGDKKRRRRRDGIGYLDGQIGSYRSGVQVLKKDDIQRVKKFKVKK